MLKTQGLAGFLGKQVRKAARETLSSHHDEVEEEGDVTGRLVANIKNEVNDRTKNEVSFKGIVVPHSGRGSLESKTGADIAGILDINIPAAKHTKLFLAQAKRCKGDGSIAGDELGRLIKQCEDMLRITDSSFVVLYENDGIYVADAASVQQSTTLGESQRKSRTR